MIVKLNDLNASQIGQYVTSHVQIIGESEQKAIPKTVSLSCKNCETIARLDFESINVSQQNTFLETMLFQKNSRNLAQLVDTPCKERKKHRFTTTTETHMDFTIFYVRDLLDPLIKFNQRVYRNKKIYLINHKLPNAKQVAIGGRVFIEPLTRDITLIADTCVAYKDDASAFQVTETDKSSWKKYFSLSSKDWSFQIAPNMVNRPLAQEVLNLELQSISVIPDIHGTPIRGSLRTIFYGDTKTSKSQALKDVTVDHYSFGELIIGESSSRTGITYSIDMDIQAIIWGALPLNDLGFLGIDGMHTLNPNEWHETREALENQKVVVRRSLTGEALARTRVVGIYNPNQPLNHYPYKCQGITDVFCFNDAPDVTRWDIFLPFGSEDVSRSEIVRATPKERPIPDDVFIRHVFWAWSRRPEHIEYTEAAKNSLIQGSEKLMNKYAIDFIPVVHNGYRDVVSRVAVAYASMMHSTDMTHENVIVKTTHVEKAINLFRKMVSVLELEEFKHEMEGKFNISDAEFSQILSDLDNYSVMILDAIKVEPQSSTLLADRLDVSTKTIKRRYSPLSKHRLIQTKQGKGIALTPRGVTFLKKYQKRDKEIRTPLTEKVASGLNTPISKTTRQTNYQQNDSDEFITKLIHEKVQKHEEAIKKIFRLLGDIEFDCVLSFNIDAGNDALHYLANRELRIWHTIFDFDPRFAKRLLMELTPWSLWKNCYDDEFAKCYLRNTNEWRQFLKEHAPELLSMM